MSVVLMVFEIIRLKVLHLLCEPLSMSAAETV